MFQLLLLLYTIWVFHADVMSMRRIIWMQVAPPNHGIQGLPPSQGWGPWQLVLLPESSQGQRGPIQRSCLSFQRLRDKTPIVAFFSDGRSTVRGLWNERSKINHNKSNEFKSQYYAGPRINEKSGRIELFWTLFFCDNKLLRRPIWLNLLYFH